MCRVIVDPAPDQPGGRCPRAAKYMNDDWALCGLHAKSAVATRVALNRRFARNRDLPCSARLCDKKGTSFGKCPNKDVNTHTRLCHAHTIELVGEKGLDKNYRLTPDELVRILIRNKQVLDRNKHLAVES
jgi:hypothetical protein